MVGSGVATSKPSARRTASRSSATTDGTTSLSKSALYSGNSPISRGVILRRQAQSRSPLA